MLRKPLITLTLALLLAAGFCFGVARLFLLRYETGEVYPPYSTLRPDPLGAKAIYEAFGELPGVEVRRNFQPLKKLQPGRPVTLIYLGLNHESFWTERELQEFDTMVLNGARAVFAFHPFDRQPLPAEVRREMEEERAKKQERLKDESEKKPRKKKDDRKEAGKKARDEETDRSGLVPFKKAAKQFGFQFDFLPAEEGKVFDRHAFLFAPGGNLERDISWHSALCFSELAPEWKPLYLSDTKPVVVERAYGRGSIVLASDSFFLSNEALRSERHPQLLARLFDGPPLLIFDEEHLGVTDQPGVTQLALKYRLHGVIAGLALVAVFFVWKNAVRFIPAHDEGADQGGAVRGKDSSQGLVNLLHRSIAPADLLGACVAEWKKSFSHQPAAMARADRVLAEEQTRPKKQRDPVAAYRAISETLHHD